MDELGRLEEEKTEIEKFEAALRDQIITLEEENTTLRQKVEKFLNASSGAVSENLNVLTVTSPYNSKKPIGNDNAIEKREPVNHGETCNDHDPFKRTTS